MGSRDGDKHDIVIPASIGKLKKLQTLWGFAVNNYIFPKEICELHELRYLNIDISGNLNIGTHQTKLHTLQSIEFSQWVMIDTVKFTNLHVLRVVEETEEEDGNGLTLESIANLTSLQTLDLTFFKTDFPTMKPLSYCKRLKSVDLWGTITDPSELSYLPHSVTDLSLYRSDFTEDPMPILGNLLNLTNLRLSAVYEGKKMVCSRNAFPSLQILRLQQFQDLEELQVEEGLSLLSKVFK